MIKAARTTNVPAVTSDYLPTVLDYLGVAPTEARHPIDGISLRGVIEGTMKQRPRPIGFQSKGTRALSDNRFKLVRSPQRDAAAELYDLRADPGETTDVAALHPEITQQMTQQLRAFEASCEASDKAR